MFLGLPYKELKTESELKFESNRSSAHCCFAVVQWLTEFSRAAHHSHFHETAIAVWSEEKPRDEQSSPGSDSDSDSVPWATQSSILRYRYGSRIRKAFHNDRNCVPIRWAIASGLWSNFRTPDVYSSGSYSREANCCLYSSEAEQNPPLPPSIKCKC